MTCSLSLDEQLALTAGASMWATVPLPEAGIPSLKMADGPMGIASGRIDERDIALLTPCPLALGASWDLPLCERVGALVGREAVRKAIDLVLAPNVNLARSPLAGRSFEYFSEEPLLTGRAAAAWVRGVQSTGTGAVAKHLVCNDSETDRDEMNVVVDERTLREVYLLPFELCAEASVAALMAAYNRVNGKWSTEQDHVIASIVKAEWGYRGPVMSDWFATHSTVGALNAGLDLEMPGPSRFLGSKAAEFIEAGALKRDRIEDAAGRISAVANKFGRAESKTLDGEGAHELLIEAAASGFVLLRNVNGVLPLDPDRRQRIAVIGPNAVAPCYQGGTFAKISVAPDTITPLGAILARFGQKAQVDFELGVEPQPRLPAMPVTPARDLGDDAIVGMTVDYFDAQGGSSAPIASETRATNSLVWFAGIHEDVLHLDRPGRVRASGYFEPKADGEYCFCVGATGPVSLSINGQEVLSRSELVRSADVMGVLKRGDTNSFTAPMKAGERARVDVDFAFDPARAHGLWYGVRAPNDADAMLKRARDLASAADVVLLFVGETSDASVESKDRVDTLLPAEQLQLIKDVTAANRKTVVIANVGHSIDTSWEDLTAAMMMVWYPGEGFGPAIAQVLAGDREPGGRMPVSIARAERDYPAFGLRPQPNGELLYSEGTCLGYRGMTAPRHTLGAGLGYADIEIVDARADLLGNGMVEIAATLENASDRAGTQVVQAYRRQPELALAGFVKAYLQPRQRREVKFCVERRQLQTWNGAWEDVADPRLFVGLSAADICVEVRISGPQTPRVAPADDYTETL